MNYLSDVEFSQIGDIVPPGIFNRISPEQHKILKRRKRGKFIKEFGYVETVVPPRLNKTEISDASNWLEKINRAGIIAPHIGVVYKKMLNINVINGAVISINLNPEKSVYGSHVNVDKVHAIRNIEISDHGGCISEPPELVERSVNVIERAYLSGTSWRLNNFSDESPFLLKLAENNKLSINLRCSSSGNISISFDQILFSDAYLRSLNKDIITTKAVDTHGDNQFVYSHGNVTLRIV